MSITVPTVWLALAGVVVILTGYCLVARRFVRWFPSWVTRWYARRLAERSER